MRDVSAEVEALASVLCEAHRKLRRHPSRRPSGLCYSIAEALIARQVVRVEVDDE